MELPSVHTSEDDGPRASGSVRVRSEESDGAVAPRLIGEALEVEGEREAAVGDVSGCVFGALVGVSWGGQPAGFGEHGRDNCAQGNQRGARSGGGREGPSAPVCVSAEPGSGGRGVSGNVGAARRAAVPGQHAAGRRGEGDVHGVATFQT